MGRADKSTPDSADSRASPQRSAPKISLHNILSPILSHMPPNQNKAEAPSVGQMLKADVPALKKDASLAGASLPAVIHLPSSLSASPETFTPAPSQEQSAASAGSQPSAPQTPSPKPRFTSIISDGGLHLPFSLSSKTPEKGEKPPHMAEHAKEHHMASGFREQALAVRTAHQPKQPLNTAAQQMAFISQVGRQSNSGRPIFSPAQLSGAAGQKMAAAFVPSSKTVLPPQFPPKPASSSPPPPPPPAAPSDDSKASQRPATTKAGAPLFSPLMRAASVKQPDVSANLVRKPVVLSSSERPAMPPAGKPAIQTSAVKPPVVKPVVKPPAVKPVIKAPAVISSVSVPKISPITPPSSGVKAAEIHPVTPPAMSQVKQPSPIFTPSLSSSPQAPYVPKAAAPKPLRSPPRLGPVSIQPGQTQNAAELSCRSASSAAALSMKTPEAVLDIKPLPKRQPVSSPVTMTAASSGPRPASGSTPLPPSSSVQPPAQPRPAEPSSGFDFLKTPRPRPLGAEGRAEVRPPSASVLPARTPSAVHAPAQLPKRETAETVSAPRVSPAAPAPASAGGGTSSLVLGPFEFKFNSKSKPAARTSEISHAPVLETAPAGSAPKPVSAHVAVSTPRYLQVSEPNALKSESKLSVSQTTQAAPHAIKAAPSLSLSKSHADAASAGAPLSMGRVPSAKQVSLPAAEYLPVISLPSLSLPPRMRAPQKQANIEKQANVEIEEGASKAVRSSVSSTFRKPSQQPLLSRKPSSPAPYQPASAQEEEPTPLVLPDEEPVSAPASSGPIISSSKPAPTSVSKPVPPPVSKPAPTPAPATKRLAPVSSQPLVHEPELSLAEDKGTDKPETFGQKKQSVWSALEKKKSAADLLAPGGMPESPIVSFSSLLPHKDLVDEGAESIQDPPHISPAQAQAPRSSGRVAGAEWAAAYRRELSLSLPPSPDIERLSASASWELKKYFFGLRAEAAYWRVRSLPSTDPRAAAEEKSFLSMLESANPEQRLAIEMCINLTKALQSLLLATAPKTAPAVSQKAWAIYNQIISQRPELRPLLYYRLSRLLLQRSYQPGSGDPSPEYMQIVARLDEPSRDAVFAMRAAFFDRILNHPGTSPALRDVAVEHYSRLLLNRGHLQQLLSRYLRVREALDRFLAVSGSIEAGAPGENERWLPILNQDDPTRLILIYELASVFLQAEQRDLPDSGEEVPMRALSGSGRSAQREGLPAAQGAVAASAQGIVHQKAGLRGRAARSRAAAVGRHPGKKSNRH